MLRGNGFLIAGLVAIALSGAAPARADESSHPWSVTPGLGLVDSDAVGSAPAVSVEFEREFRSGLSLGLRRLDSYNLKGKTSKDTNYHDLFVRFRWRLTAAQPFLEAGVGDYSSDYGPENENDYNSGNGWFAGLGVDLPWAERRSVVLAARYHDLGRGDRGQSLDFLEVQAAVRFRF